VPAALPDLVCFSHLRWDHVFQRPHHLMSRAARTRRVFFIEEPVDASARGVAVTRRGDVTVVTPHVPAGLPDAVREPLVEALIRDFLAAQRVDRPVLWLYTPLAVPLARRLDAAGLVYDCMDELSAFNEASPRLAPLERELLRLADVVFTGGESLWHAKRRSHPSVHAFPSAVDAAHFAMARRTQPDPEDQAAIPGPRLGWFGVIDERLDLELLAAVARRRPDWSIVLVGPVAKIPVAAIPAEPNVHWLGQKPYEALPSYLAGWDVAIMPFARNAATAFISPTKTPEYLAGGRPVVSTTIADVVRPYGVRGLVRIADEPDQFIAACEAAMAEDAATRVAAADAFLAGISWDRTWAAMERHLERVVTRRPTRVPTSLAPTDQPTIGVAAGRGTT
jgi:UDP-galactopyranose mutase